MSRGGHFAALEAPELLSADVTTFLPIAAGGAERLRAAGRGVRASATANDRGRRHLCPASASSSSTAVVPHGRARPNARSEDRTCDENGWHGVVHDAADRPWRQRRSSLRVRRGFNRAESAFGDLELAHLELLNLPRDGHREGF